MEIITENGFLKNSQLKERLQKRSIEELQLKIIGKVLEIDRTMMLIFLELSGIYSKESNVIKKIKKKKIY